MAELCYNTVMFVFVLAVLYKIKKYFLAEYILYCGMFSLHGF
jgi:hypothetical protein